MIDSLMEAGAVLNKKNYSGRDVLLYACNEGVDPQIFDTILKWNTIKGEFSSGRISVILVGMVLLC